MDNFIKFKPFPSLFVSPSPFILCPDMIPLLFLSERQTGLVHLPHDHPSLQPRIELSVAVHLGLELFGVVGHLLVLPPGLEGVREGLVHLVKVAPQVQD